MKFSIVITALSFLVLSSCSKGSDSNTANDVTATIRSDGTCGFDIVSAFGDIRHGVVMYNSSHNRDYLTGIINSCEKLQGLIGTRSCEAQNSVTMETVSVSYETARPLCDEARSK